MVVDKAGQACIDQSEAHCGRKAPSTFSTTPLDRPTKPEPSLAVCAHSEPTEQPPSSSDDSTICPASSWECLYPITASAPTSPPNPTPISAHLTSMHPACASSNVPPFETSVTNSLSVGDDANPSVPLSELSQYNEDFDVQAANKRWRSRTALITKALEAWTPSPNMPISAVNASLFASSGEHGSKSNISNAPHLIAKTDFSPPQKDALSKTECKSEPVGTTTEAKSEPVVEPEPMKPPDSQAGIEGAQTQTQLDPDQQSAIDAALEGESFFLTGSAGTGKSFVLKRIIKLLRERGLAVRVTASTGCAAVAIQGSTIHSACGMGLGLESIQILRRKSRSRLIRQKLLEPDVLIIDEVSMLDSILFDKIEAMFSEARDAPFAATRDKLRLAKLRKQESKPEPKPEVKKETIVDTANQGRDGGHAERKKRRIDEVIDEPFDKPFGGVQVILCGDFFQLPPVKPSDYKLQYSRKKFFAFDSDAWKRAISKTIVLQQVHRQSDRHFIGLLNELRYGIVSHRTMRVLSACRVAGADNEAYDDGQQVHYTKLYAYRQQVDAENIKRLQALNSRPVAYGAKNAIEHRKLGGLHVSAVEALLKNTTAVERLILKEGARVLCVKNIDQAAGIVNGAAGTIVGFTLPKNELAKRRLEMRATLTTAQFQEKMLGAYTVDGLMKDEVAGLEHEAFCKFWKKCSRGSDGVTQVDCEFGDAIPVVRFDNGITRTMSVESWSVYGLQGQEVAVRKQIPLILGWALTIHKSQGMTLELVETDVGKAFDYGQVYVAISRARSMQGLRLTTFSAKRVMAHEDVRRFYDSKVSDATTPSIKIKAEKSKRIKAGDFK